MTTITVEIPTTYKTYTKKEEQPILQQYLTDSFFDYVEVMQDIKLWKELSKSKKFQTLESKIRKKAWSL